VNGTKARTVAVWALALLAAALVALIVLQALGVDTYPLIKVAGPKAFRILLIAAGSVLLVRVAYVAIHRIEVIVDDGDPHLSEREKRARTLATILRKATAVTVAAVAVLTILQELGVDTRAIITAAGIGGLAVGFGAQNLVRDVISGFFMLMENQIRVGDVVTINDKTGVVEDITLRTTILRDLEGTVHIFPNGAIQYVSNRTKDWSRAVLDVGVAYKEDVDRVMEVLREIGEELAADEVHRQNILEPLQVLGVDDFGDSQVTIKVMVTTRPLKQWEVARELRRRIKKRFDREGIEIPFPHLSLYFGEASKPIAVTGLAAPAGGRSGAGDAQPRSGTGDAAPQAGQAAPGA